MGHNLKTKYKQKIELNPQLTLLTIFTPGEKPLSTPAYFEHLSSIFNIQAGKQKIKKLDGI